MKQSDLPFDSWVGPAPIPRLGGLTFSLSKTTQWRWLIASLLLTDFVLIGIAFRAAYWIRFELQIPIFRLGVVPQLDFYQEFSLASLPIWIAVFAVFGLYTKDTLLGGTKEYDLIFRATTFFMFMIVVAGFLDVLVLSRGWLMVVWLLVLGCLIAGRFLLRRMVYRLRKNGFFLTPALIIGANDEGCLLGDQLVRWHRSGLHLIGYVDDQVQEGTDIGNNLRVLGGLDALPEIIRRYGVGELVMATSALNRERMIQIFQRHGMSDEVNLRMSSGLFEIITTGLKVKELAFVPLVGIDKVRLTGLNEVLKLLLDIGLTVPLLVLTSPLLLAIAIGIKLDSPGPVLHRRRVMGLNGSRFDAFKFRTMKINGDEILAEHPELLDELNRTHKLKDDPRVTRMGGFLRKFSLDELPQLFNVLRREMSLVGPRMISPPEMKQYKKWGINLLTVRPGITGLWQVSGRSDLSYDRRVQLDMHYVRNWSIWLDLYLLFQTIPVVIRGTGAY
ncbi:MAG TPA: sugar transferase [Anaerolineales bacterium]|nr:sugar transferase [Anaerolineales bacterium]